MPKEKRGKNQSARPKNRKPVGGAKRAPARSAARPSRGAARKNAKRWVYTVVVSALGIAVIISFFLPSMLSNARKATAGTVGQAVAIQGRDHIKQGDAHLPYNTVPPTSGPHYEQSAPWGIHTQPVQDELQVHNLEHGGVMIQYNTQDQTLISKLEQVAKTQPNYPCYLIVAPYPTISSPIALTAWGYILNLQQYDETQIVSFIKEYRDKGPERVVCNP